MKKTKRKIKKVVKVFLVAIAVLVIVICILHFGIRFKSDSKVEINVGDKYDYKMKATFFTKDISSKLEKKGKNKKRI